VKLILLVNGNHLAADNTFIEKRRRGLARFANALVRHPVLSQEQLVVMFLTVPTVSPFRVVLLEALSLRTS
jgi:sorting nexin-8